MRLSVKDRLNSDMSTQGFPTSLFPSNVLSLMNLHLWIKESEDRKPHSTLDMQKLRKSFIHVRQRTNRHMPRALNFPKCILVKIFPKSPECNVNMARMILKSSHSKLNIMKTTNLIEKWAKDLNRYHMLIWKGVPHHTSSGQQKLKQQSENTTHS